MKAAILTNQLFSWEDHNKLAIGGGEKVTLQISEMLQEIEYNVSIYQYSKVTFSKTFLGAKVHGIHNSLRNKGFWTSICDYFYNETKDFDLVIINLPDFASGMVREDTILISHGAFWCGKSAESLGEYANNKLRKIFSSVGKNVVVHEFTRDAIRNLGLNRVADEVVCIENYVDTDLFKPDEKLPIIIFPGRAEIAKGTDILPKVLEILSLPACQIAWVGGGSQFNKIKKLEDKYNNFYAMNVDMDQMSKIYADAAICVVLNTVSKGNSLTLMEGMASGCACIGVKGGTTLIRDNENGLLCDGTPEDITEKIMILVNDTILRGKLGFNAREDIIRDHSRKEWREKWLNLINEGR